MRAVLVVGAHLDDAVLSCGQFLAGRPDAVVATVFAGIPAAEQPLTDYDAKCGFETSQQAVEARRQEDIEALSVLQAKAVHMGFLDSQYGLKANGPDIVEAIAAVIAEVDPEFVVGPLGLVHPDHELLRRALLEATSRLTMDVWLAEDLPYRVQEPRASVRVLDGIESEGVHPASGFIGTGSIASKMNALWCYGSQMGLPEFENRHELLVSERYWRVLR